MSDATIDEGFAYFAEMFHPILDVYDECGVRFALEVHPTEIAFDIYTAQRAIDAVGGRKAFGFNFDPSHIALATGRSGDVSSASLKDRIYHVHMKDAALQLDGKSGILASHLNFGHQNRGWTSAPSDHGGVDFEEIIRALNHIGYHGPLSIGVGRQRHGARSRRRGSCAFTKDVDFAPSDAPSTRPSTSKRTPATGVLLGQPSRLPPCPPRGRLPRL